MDYKLTIAIPTYNRHDKIKLLIKNLLCQKLKRVEILIIDNNSNPSVRTCLENSVPEFNNCSNIKLIDNQFNIGLGDNLIRCIEMASSKWVWLLGDDDMPLQNSIDMILERIKKVDENTGLIKFNSKAGHHPKKSYYIKNEVEFLTYTSNHKYYSNLLFISSSVINRNIIGKYMQDMYRFTLTLAPQIIGFIKSISDGHFIYIDNQFIVKHGRADKDDIWDSHRLRAGLSFFPALNEELTRKLLPNLSDGYFQRFYRILLTEPLRRRDLMSYYWKNFYLRLAGLYSGIKSFYLIILSVMMPPILNSKIIYKLTKNKIKNISDEINKRS